MCPQSKTINQGLDSDPGGDWLGSSHRRPTRLATNIAYRCERRHLGSYSNRGAVRVVFSTWLRLAQPIMEVCIGVDRKTTNTMRIGCSWILFIYRAGIFCFCQQINPYSTLKAVFHQCGDGVLSMMIHSSYFTDM